MQNNILNSSKFSLLIMGLKCIQYPRYSNDKLLQIQLEQFCLEKQNINFNKIIKILEKTNLKNIYIMSYYYYSFVEEKSSQTILNILKDYTYSLKENIPFSSITYNYLRKFYFCYKQYSKNSNTINKINISAINKIALVNLYLIYKTLTKGDIYSSYKYLKIRN